MAERPPRTLLIRSREPPDCLVDQALVDGCDLGEAEQAGVEQSGGLPVRQDNVTVQLSDSIWLVIIATVANRFRGDLAVRASTRAGRFFVATRSAKGNRTSATSPGFTAGRSPRREDHPTR